MIRTTIVGGATALAILAAASAFAQHGPHHGHHGHEPAAAAESLSTKALQAANARMHEGMEIDYTGDADIDFARAMIPHHQGAIDMAEAVLAHGKDPEVRKLADAIIAAQKAEIAWLEGWLAKNARAR